MVKHNEAPDIAAMSTDADYAVAGSLTCSSGQLKLAGCTDYLPEAFAQQMRTSDIGAAFLTFDLGSIDPVDGLEGNDRYELHVWPASSPAPTSVVKRWNAVTRLRSQ